MLVFCVTAFLLFQLISLYLSWPKQVILGSACILLGLAANRFSASRIVTIALMFISITATLRYGWWRVHLLVDFFSDETNRRVGLDAFFLLLLASAEAYTILIMVLGYMQTVRPLRRVPIPMPPDYAQWPHVDIVIPTFNEPLGLVRYTALAALNIDYPPEKLHVYILDDGTREEFKEFSLEAGVSYITREEHQHAKAGNINHALTMMDSPYVAIFDCDHVPTRSFLQMSLGWMLVDSNLAMLQTPHHFYSPDPFERNLLQYKTIPNEAELFYGIVQDGNDLWNATFFCGSCALIRRSALDDVGGIATETVTEDAHTSLRMQKRGYNTAYINIPQAAGLATESLAAHVGQRIRWARGMIQILRTENPLFAWKMKLTQRLCYFNAMAHFLYAVPRLVFLLAPLVYLLLGRTIIPGYWIAILAYAFPHLILSNLTNSRVQGRYRHSFWNEIYEAVLAPYILAPTLLAFINPKLGKFNVTGKGSITESSQYDSKIAAPTKWMLLLNFIGLVVAPYRLLVTDQQHTGAVIMNVVWVLFNMVILGVAAAVAYEQKQKRESVRIEARLAVRLHMPDGRLINCMSMNMSIGGASIELPEKISFTAGDSFRVAFPEQSGDEEIGVKVVGSRGKELRLAFQVPTIAEQETLTRALYSRADAWISSLESKEDDRPLVSFGRVMRLSMYGIYQICRSFFTSTPKSADAGPAAATVAVLIALAAGSCGHAFAVSHTATVPHDGNGTAVQTLQNGQRMAPEGTNSPAADASNSGVAEAPAYGDSTAHQALSLKDMGLLQTIEMRGPHSYYSLHFILSHVMVPRQATLTLNYAFDAGLDPQSATLKVMLNETVIGSISPSDRTGINDGLATASISVPDTLLIRNNILTFECTGGGVMQGEEQAKSHILVRISPTSRLVVSGERLVWQNDLSKLPLPIFDGGLQTTTTVPFVFLSQPSPKTLEAAGIVASWLGVLGSSKPVRYTVSIGQIPPGNAIVFSDNRSMLPVSLQTPVGAGPLLALRSNPLDPYGKVLVLAGDDDSQLLTVARTLSLTKSATATTPAEGLPLSGDTAQIPELTMPPERKRDDAPRWLPTSKAAPLASCRAQDTLQSDGSNPIPVYFHVPPDLYYGETQDVEMHVHYRYNALAVAPGSALRVVLNGLLVGEIPLLPGTGTLERQRVLLVPTADIRPFGNTILFNFDFIRAHPEAAPDSAAAALKGEILCNSSLDLQGLALWTRMPNLELFANAGFPFTRMADLSETTVVLPAVPNAQELSLYLHLMSHFGAQTGYPVLRVAVSAPNTVISSGRDYLILGAVASQPAFTSLDSLLPVTLDANGVHVKEARGYSSYVSTAEDFVSHWWSKLLGNAERQGQPSNEAGIPQAMVEEIESPSSSDRSIVMVALRQDSAEDTFADVFLDRSQSTDIAGSVSVLQNSKFASYTMDGKSYHVGSISAYAMMRIWLTQYFLPLLLVVTALSFVLAYWTWGWVERRAAERLKLAEPGQADEITEDSGQEL